MSVHVNLSGFICKDCSRDFAVCLCHQPMLVLPETCEGDKRDAERYRFLRDRANSATEPFAAIQGPGGISQWTGEKLDQAIDLSEHCRFERMVSENVGTNGTSTQNHKA